MLQIRSLISSTLVLAPFAFSLGSKTITRNASILGHLRSNTYDKPKRLGRGPSSGKGKTSGRGHKGQKAKESVQPWFEGGQTPLYKLVPKKGFSNKATSREITKVNLDQIQQWVEKGRLDASEPITMKHLLDSRLCRGIKDGVKILGNGKENFNVKIDIITTAASRDAIQAIEAAGGKYSAKYYNRLGLRALLHPQYFKSLPLEARPVSRKHRQFYKNYDVRGYLSKPPAQPTA
ncbi:ribosomal protein L18e/L15P [Lipomyces japonicus]|uniref:mitochondrial 54S ribosomal protein uL15m n=1 Tax=Lipomyces japonicus TaxID=56871 RepID=UPI0034CEBEDA